MTAHHEKAAAAILGAWLGITLLMWFVAAGSFSTVDRVLRASDSRLAAATKPLEQNRTRLVLRYVAAEINRTCFRAYGWIEIVLGVLLLAVLLRPMARDVTAVVIAGAMLGLVLLLTFIITPEIAALGRGLDFVPRDPAPPGLSAFRALHATFTGLDAAKFLAGVFLLIRWLAK